MLEPLLQVLSSQRIILASSSPRRCELLRKIVSLKIDTTVNYVFVAISWHFSIHVLRVFAIFQGLQFEVIPSTFEETLDKSAFKHPFDYVLENSKQKALEVAGRVDKESVCHYELKSARQVSAYHIRVDFYISFYSILVVKIRTKNGQQVSASMSTFSR